MREKLTKHKISLRNHILFIRDSLKEEFDIFFNNLLQNVKQEWNLFRVQEVLIKQTRDFTKKVKNALNLIAQQDSIFSGKSDLKRLYE